MARTPPPITYIAPENHNVSMSQVGATGADHSPAPGQMTVRFQEPIGNRRMDDYQMQNAFASAILDQLEDLGTDVKEHCRRLMPRQYSAVPHIERLDFSMKFLSKIMFWFYPPFQYFFYYNINSILLLLN